jgi:2,3-bisphosphoglycerate-dependent phosphoglycerate mutase
LHIYLIRHGETDWNTKFLFQGQSDTELNKTGIMQAKSIAKEFKDRNIGGIISSDLKRAFKTAEIIASACGCRAKIEKDKRQRERHYGNLEGKLYELYRHQKKGFTGERDSRFFPRVNAAFKSIIKRYKGKDVIIVSHGGVVRQIVAFMLGLEDYKKLRIYNASISEIFYNEKKKAFFLLLLNSVSHLPRKARNKIEYHIKGV